MTQVIDTYAKSGRKDSGEMANRVLRRMEDMYARGNKYVKPNVHTMNTVIDVSDFYTYYSDTTKTDLCPFQFLEGSC